MDRTQSIQKNFGAAAARYASSPVHRSGPDLDAMLDAGVATGRERVLDLGCGPGHTALAFAARVERVVALDLTPAMLEQARRLAAERGLENLRFEEGDASALRFEDASFDVVSSRLSAHHVADPGAMLREVARVLVPGGCFLLSDTVADEDPARDSFLNALEVLRDPSHVRDHRVSDWEAMFRAAGLEAECLERFVIEQDFDAWVERIGTPADAITGLRALFRAAPDALRRHFGVDAEGGGALRLPLALLRGRRR